MALVAVACGDDSGKKADTTTTAGSSTATTTGGSSTPTTAKVTEPLQATEIGVTATEIKISIMADVDNAAAPGLFKGAKDAMLAFGDYINGQGGLAGRKLVVEFIDSKLSADAAQSAILQACTDSLAMVGNTALFVSNPAPFVECKDKGGVATGLPDMVAIATGFNHQCAPTSYSAAGTLLDCPTKDQHPQTYRVPEGPAKYFKENLGVTKGAYIVGNDIKGTLDATRPLIVGDNTFVPGVEFAASGRDPQTTYTPFVQRLKSQGIDYVVNYGAGGHLAKALKEMAVQGYRPKVVSCTSACYNPAFLKEAGDTAEGTYITYTQVPLEETSVPAMKAMSDALGSKLDGFGVGSWVQGLQFRDVINAVVKQYGVNGITRAHVLEATKNLHSFDADGLIGGSTDIGVREPGHCFVILQVKGGKFVRVYPTEVGKLDCNTPRISVQFDNK
jgi:ABC-type branched-subunit amino acid transport system substrate-binding protein